MNSVLNGFSCRFSTSTGQTQPSFAVPKLQKQRRRSVFFFFFFFYKGMQSLGSFKLKLREGWDIQKNVRWKINAFLSPLSLSEGRPRSIRDNCVLSWIALHGSRVGIRVSTTVTLSVYHHITDGAEKPMFQYLLRVMCIALKTFTLFTERFSATYVSNKCNECKHSALSTPLPCISHSGIRIHENVSGFSV